MQGTLTAGLIVLLMVAGCSSPQQTSNKTVLRFCFWGNFTDLDLFKAISAEFEKKNPDVEIRLEYITGDYNRKLSLVLVSNAAADIILMDDEPYPAYAARSYLEDLRPYIERDRSELHLDDFLPTSLDSFIYKGVQAALPWDGGPNIVYYNKDLFDAAGIPYPSESWTYDDFRAIAKKLTIDRDGDGRMDQYGTNLWFGNFMGLEQAVWSYGGDVLTPDRTQFDMNSPRAIEAAQMAYDMKFKDHSIAWSGEGDTISLEAQLLTGRMGMLMGAAYAMIILRTVPDAMRWGIADMPYGPYGERYTRTTWDGISINAHSPYKEQAWRFIKHLLSEDSQALIGRRGRSLPVRRSFALKYYVGPDNDPDRLKVLEATRYGRLTPITPKFLEIGVAMQRPIDKMCLGLMEPKEALDAMAPDVNAALAKELAKWGKDKKH